MLVKFSRFFEISCRSLNIEYCGCSLKVVSQGKKDFFFINIYKYIYISVFDTIPICFCSAALWHVTDVEACSVLKPLHLTLVEMAGVWICDFSQIKSLSAKKGSSCIWLPHLVFFIFSTRGPCQTNRLPLNSRIHTQFVDYAVGKPVQTTLQSLVPVRIIKSFLSVLRSRSKVSSVQLWD